MLTERGKILQQSAEVLLAHLAEHIAYRELKVIASTLGYSPDQLHFQLIESAYGPGNVVLIYVQSESVTEVFSAFGERGLPAEQVAEKAVAQQAGISIWSREDIERYPILKLD